MLLLQCCLHMGNYEEQTEPGEQKNHHLHLLKCSVICIGVSEKQINKKSYVTEYCTHKNRTHSVKLNTIWGRNSKR